MITKKKIPNSEQLITEEPDIVLTEKPLPDRKRKISAPVVDYRKLRLRNLNSNEYSHLKLLIFWPIFGLLFAFLERFYVVETYHPMHSYIDDLIPFHEIFVIPYMFWFVLLVGMHLYTLLYDTKSFRKMMYFIIFTHSITILIYFIFPTCQELRPTEFERDNILTRFMQSFYSLDTNTNVFPSIHVIGSLAVMFTAWHCKRLKNPIWKIAFTIIAILICLSTVFLKQHSVLDGFAAIIISIVAYIFCFLVRGKSKMKKYNKCSGDKV